MILGTKALLELVEREQLVEGLAKRELTNPEGAGFDLRVGRIHAIDGAEGFLGIHDRSTPSTQMVAQHPPWAWDMETDALFELFKIKPGEFYLMETIERVNLPLNLTANLKPRTTTFRCGLNIRTGNVAPGYRGTLTFAVKNEGPADVFVEMGARIVHIQFEEVMGEASPYRGQWAGGRVSTQGERERQV